MEHASTTQRHWPASRLRVVGVLVAGLVMCAASLGMLVHGLSGPDLATLVVGVAGAVFFVPCAVLAASAAVRGGGVTLASDGVRVRTSMGRARLPWDSIDDAGLLQVRGRTFLALTLRPGAPAWLSRGHRWTRKANARLGIPGDVFVPDTMVPDLSGLLAAVHAALGTRGTARTGSGRST